MPIVHFHLTSVVVSCTAKERPDVEDSLRAIGGALYPSTRRDIHFVALRSTEIHVPENELSAFDALARSTLAAGSHLVSPL